MRNTILLSTIIAYFVIMVVLGIWYSRKVQTSDDYMVAGRRLSRLVLAGTLLATWCGAGTIIGSANFTYQYGPLASIFYSAGPPIGIIIMFFFLAGRIRELGQYTVPQIIEIHYGSAVRVVTGIAILLAYVGIAAEQFGTLGYILNMTTGMPERLGAAIGGLVMVVSAVTGGLLAVAYTDAISAVIITAGLVAGFIFVVAHMGGLGSVMSSLPADHTTWLSGLNPIQLIGFCLPVLFLFLGDQNMYQRMSSARDARTAKQSVPTLLAGVLLFSFIVIVISSASVTLLPGINPDTAVLGLAAHTMPIGVGALILVAAVGLAVTTGNSFLLSGTANFVYDIYGVAVKGEISQRKQLLYSRGLLVLLGVIGYFLAEFFPSILAVQLYAYTMYGAAITPSLLALFFWRRATPAGALASIITGAGATIVWEIPLSKPFDLNSIVVSLPLSIVALVGVSLVTKTRRRSGMQPEPVAPGTGSEVTG